MDRALNIAAGRGRGRRRGRGPIDNRGRDRGRGRVVPKPAEQRIKTAVFFAADILSTIGPSFAQASYRIGVAAAPESHRRGGLRSQVWASCGAVSVRRFGYFNNESNTNRTKRDDVRTAWTELQRRCDGWHVDRSIQSSGKTVAILVDTYRHFGGEKNLGRGLDHSTSDTRGSLHIARAGRERLSSPRPTAWQD